LTCSVDRPVDRVFSSSSSSSSSSVIARRYEPYLVVAHGGLTPPYDERFTGYGKNKIQHVTHLRWAGWRFAVAPRGCFLTHFPHPISSAKKAWLADRKLHSSVDQVMMVICREGE